MARKKFTADFETTTDPSDCRVWAYAVCEIGNSDNFVYGNRIEDFINFCQATRNNYLIYFHNLKFDGEYIFNYLLNNGYEYIRTKKERKDKTFSCLISDTGQFYSIEIYFQTANKKHVNKVTIYDSLKILNFSVDKIAKDFNLSISKLEIDYHEYREVDHELTPDEVAYIKNDVTIMADALKIMFDEKLTKMTIGSNALAQYKELNKNFNKYYPELAYEIDKDIRKSYKGGFTYLNPIFKDVSVERGSVFDVNSLYPSVMYNEYLPFGDPLYFEGKYENDKLFHLYIQTLTCTFKVKEGFIPTIQLKNNLSFMPNEYIESSNDELVTLTLTNIDLDLFFKHYDIENITYHNGWKFKGIKGLFGNYIDKFTAMKTQAKKDGNNARYLISKLMLNSLYGKFGLNPDVRSKYPTLDDNGIIKYKMHEKEIRTAIYIPVASFITSYARYKTITTSQAIKEYSIKEYGIDKYIYSDTDSIHCLLESDEELKDIIDIDDYTLGYWKHESNFTRAKFLRQKCYIEEIEDKIQVTVAGLPKKLGKFVNFDNFNDNFTVEGKLTFKHVKGGVILENTSFSIKKEKKK